MRFVTDILAKANLVVDGSVTLTTTPNASVDTDRFLVQDGTVVKYRTGAQILSDIGAQGALTLTTTGSSGASTLIGNTLNIPNYTLSGLGGVPTSRTLTINGTAFDLSADRSWSVGTVTSVGIVTGSTGTDINVSGSPVTSSGNITLNIPDASATARGVITTGSQTIGGLKTFNSGLRVDNGSTGRINITIESYGNLIESLTCCGSTSYRDLHILANTLYLYNPVNISNIPNATIDTDRFLVSDSGVIKYRTGTQILSDIGAQGALTLTTTGTSGPATLVGNTLNIPQYQAVLTNPVTGTGTTNYVTKWTSSSAVGNSQIFDNGTNVGIGTITPNTILEASQSTNGDAAIRITNSNAGTNATAQFFANNGTTQTQFFHTGINYTTGGSQVVNYANLGGIYNASTGIALSAAGASGIILFGTGSSQTERMRITSGGNILINTTTGTGRLVIAQSNAVQPAILLPTDESTIQGPVTNTQIRMGSNLVLGGSNILTLGTNGAERVRITNGGNILIGTITDTGHKVNIVGGAGSQLRVEGGEADVWLVSTSGGAGTWRLLGSSGTTTKVFRIYDNDAGADRINIKVGGQIQFNTYTSSSSFTGTAAGVLGFDSSGNVITLSPTLYPSGSGSTNYLVKWTGTNTLGNSIAYESGNSFVIDTAGETRVNIRSASGSGNALFFTESSVADRYLIGSPAGSGDLVFRSNSFSFATGTERMRLSSSGNLGLGTASPQYSLDSTGVINSNAFGTFLGFSNPVGRTFNYVTSYASGNTINYPGTGTAGFQYNYFANNEFYTTAGGTSNLLMVGFRNQNYVRSTVSSVPFQMIALNNLLVANDANDLGTVGQLYTVFGSFLREATASPLGGNSIAYQFNTTTRLRSGFYTNTRWGNENLQVADTTASQASTITDYDFLLNTTNVGSSSGGPGTITNFYLLRHVTNIGATGTITNRWGLYLTDSSFKSYHAGNFLIGTSTDAGYKLDVATGNDNAIRIINSVGGNNNGLALAVGSGTPWIDFWGSRLDIKYNTSPGSWNGGANTFITILSGGNVGIGTTNPTNKLVVTGRVVSSASGNSALFLASDTQVGGANLYLNSAFSGAGTPAVQVETNHPLLLVTNNIERVRITSGGNVGINETNPGNRLNIKGGNGDQLGLNNSGERFTQISFANNGSQQAAIWYDNTDNDFVIHAAAGKSVVFQTNGSNERMRVNTGGNVLIGTTTDSGFKLDVNGTGIVRGKFNVSANISDYTATFVNTNSSSYGIYIQAGGTYPAIDVYNYNATSLLASLKGNGQLRLAQYTSTSSFPGTAAGFIGFDSSGNLITVASAGGVGGSGTTNYVARWTASTTLGIGVLFDNGTNVGIGTTSPSNARTVITTAGVDGANEIALALNHGDSGLAVNQEVQLNFGQGGVGTTSLAQIGAAYVGGSFNGDLIFRTNLGASGNLNERVRITSSGSVGIGTTSPTYRLEVASDKSRFFNVAVGGTVGGTYAAYSDSVVGIGNLHLATTAGAVYINTAIALPTYINPVGGNVGIGTTSPGATLDVNGEGVVRGRLSVNTTAQTYALLNVRETSSGNGTIRYADFTNTVDTNLNFYVTQVGATTKYAEIASFSSTALVFNAQSGGNVGIGTTSPTYKLDVSGIASATSLLSGQQGLNVAGYAYLSQTISGAMTILGHNVRASDSVANQVNVVNGGWYSSMIKMYYTEGITFHSSNTSYAAGATFYQSGGTTNELMRITNGGNVGINITTPNYRLDVNGTLGVRNNAFIIGDGTSNNGRLEFYSDTTPTFAASIGTTGAGIAGVPNGSLRFNLYSGSLGWLERMRITIDGSVSIGSTTPDGRLYVERTATWSSGNLVGTNTVQYITYGSGASPGTVAISAVGAFQQATFTGSATIGNGGRHGAIDSILTVGNTSSGTITLTQSSTIRALSTISAATYYNPSAATTITHLAGIRVLPDINTGAGAITVNNKYGILIGDASGGSGSITYTTRWGIYQEGASDNNYFAAKVLIGTTTATSDALYVNGTAYINNNLTVNGTVTELSSANYKRNINTLENTLEKVDKMRAVSYNRVGGVKKEIGLIAEEVEQVYPEFVEYDNNGRPMGLNYARLTAVLLQSIKELNGRINELENRN